MGERDRVEGEVPGREPRVLPRVGHRDDVARLDVPPGAVATGQPLRRRGRAGRVAGQPAGHVVVVELLAPDHPGHGLAQDGGLVRRAPGRRQVGEEGVGLRGTGRHDRRRTRVRAGRPCRSGDRSSPAGRSGPGRSPTVRARPGPPAAGLAGQPQPELARLARAGRSRYQAAALVPTPSGARIRSPSTTWSLIASFGCAAVVRSSPPQAGRVRLVVADEPVGQRAVGIRAGVERVRAERRVMEVDRGRAGPSSGARAAGRRGPTTSVLRNQAVGSTWRVAGSGPAFVTRIRRQRSSGPAFA